jgi:signal transduction histidine kinase
MQFDRKNFEQSGTGLGLSIVKKITELYGGEMHIESIPEKQTMVRLTIGVIPENGTEE